MRLVPRIFLILQSALFVFPAVALAQADSHLNDPDQKPLPPNITTLLDSRRNAGKMPPMESLFEQLKNSGLDLKKLDEKTIADFLKNSPALKDPRNVDRLSELIRNQRNGPIGSDQLKRLLNAEKNPPGADDWRKMLDNIENFNRLGANAKGKSIPNDPKKPASANKNAANSFSPTQNHPGPVEQPKSGKNEPAEQIGRWLTRNLSDTPLMQDLLKDLGKALSEEGPSAGQTNLFESVQNEFNSMTGSTNGDSSIRWGDLFSDLKLPDLSHGGFGHSGGASNQGAAMSGPGGGADFGWTELLLVVLLVAGIVLGYILYVRAKRQQSEVSVTVEEGGTIDPLLINTREDVVKVFDSLSVAKCGTEAANWNHRQIAQELGCKHPDHRDAVDRLANLYEKARYAPAHDLFTEVEVADARARLSQIVGAGE